MSVKVIQVGVAGFGTSWRHALTSTPGVEVTALVDINRDALKDAAGFYGIPDEMCFLNPDANWSDVDADLVIDSTPQLHHHTNAMQAFAGGKHLIVVKPMSNQWETGVAMVKEAETQDKKMVVAQQLRFHPIIMKIREIVQSGDLGLIGYINQDAFFPKKGYGGSYPQPHPLLLQASIHFFDYLRWVLDQEPISVWAECWNPSWIEDEGIRCAYVSFVMSGGCCVSYRGIATESDHTSWLCNWRIEGDKGILTVVDDRIYLNGDEVSVAWEDGGDLSDLKLPQLNKIVLEQFINYLENDEEPLISGRNNLKSLEMVFGAIESSQTDRKYRMGEK